MENRKISILVVEDEAEIRKLLKFILESEGYSVKEAQNGREGIDFFDRELFDIVITDMKMPEVTGLEVIKYVKNKDPECEVIVMTGYGTADNAFYSVLAGAGEYILKPFESAAILLAVQKAVQRKSLNSKLKVSEKIRNLSEASKSIIISLPLEEFLSKTIKLACESSGADSGSIMLYNDETKTLRIGAAFPFNAKFEETKEIALGDRIAGKVLEAKKAILIQNGLRDYPEFFDIKAREDIKSSICVPLLIRDKAIGVLCVSRTQNEKLFNEEDLNVLNVFASDIALNIENTRMQNELSDKNKELLESNKRLKELAELKTDFTLNVSHELRTPITALKGAIDLLFTEGSTCADGTDTEKKLVNIVVKNSNMLGKMVDEILDFSRLETGKIKPEKDDFNISELIKETVEDLKTLVINKGLKIVIAGVAQEYIVFGDYKRLKQVLSNFISNAAKFTEKGIIKVGVEKKEDCVEVYVKDSGMGMFDEEKARIFERFYRADNEQTRKTTGFGIGLAFSKYIIEELHGGKIWFESKRNEGSTFYFCVPDKEAAL